MPPTTSSQDPAAQPTLAGTASAIAPLRGALLVDRELRALCGTQIQAAPGASAIGEQQIQASSLDLRLGPIAHEIRAGFLPNAAPIEQRLAELETARISLEGSGAVLQRGRVYLVPLEEELALEPGLRASFNPRSSTGRCDVFTRVLSASHPRFNETPPGHRGRLWIEIAPLSFPVRLARGDRLCQLRLSRGDPSLTREELIDEYRRTPLCWRGEEPLAEREVRFSDDGGIELHLGLQGRDPCGWRAKQGSAALQFAGESQHDARDFWEPVHAHQGRSILEPGGFYIFASRERVVIPPHLAAEMLPVDLGLGELRNNYAGFFDNGFGWRRAGEAGVRGTAAVLEVRAHDVPFLIEDGQVFFRLSYYRASGVPERIYAEGRAGNSYRDQDLSLARTFRSWQAPKP
ncbi:MAG TPA: 2'-deoxycytidine 5'-triphosphate deaminase [Planctomycetota bacterium]|nr:2'-deoxycytidine 5'-triphosphate deaminase [Planctomycetota bacterium]